MTFTPLKKHGASSRFLNYIDLFKYGRFLEHLYLQRNITTEKPQLFILGLPRSGTTLVYQYLIHRLEIAYFTNGVGRYPRAPLCITAWQRWRYGRYKSTFHSHYGKVDGPLAPREAGGFWGRFFDMEAYTRYKDIKSADVKTLQRTVAAIQLLYGNTAFINKNVKHMLRLDALEKIFPHSLFLIVERNLVDVGLSVLNGRYTLLQNPNAWWSVRPPNYEQIKELPVVEQVAHQLRSLQQQLITDLQQIEPSRIFYIQYAAFCQKPEHLIDQLYQPLAVPGYRNPPIPAFTLSHKQPQNEQEKRLVQLLQ